MLVRIKDLDLGKGLNTRIYPAQTAEHLLEIQQMLSQVRQVVVKHVRHRLVPDSH